MKRTLTIGVAVTALLISGAGIALAQDDAGPQDCGDAVVALTNAQNAHRDAVTADKAAIDAEAADKAEDAAKVKLNAALREAELAGVGSAADLTTANLGTLERELRTLEGKPSPVTPADAERTKRLREAVPLIRTFLAAQESHEKAQAEAVKTDAAALRTAADRIDVGTTSTAVDQARANFNRLCVNPSTTPPPPAASNTPPPAPVVVPGYSQVQAVPVGGVATGA